MSYSGSGGGGSVPLLLPYRSLPLSMPLLRCDGDDGGGGPGGGGAAWRSGAVTPGGRSGERLATKRRTWDRVQGRGACVLGSQDHGCKAVPSKRNLMLSSSPTDPIPTSCFQTPLCAPNSMPYTTRPSLPVAAPTIVHSGSSSVAAAAPPAPVVLLLLLLPSLLLPAMPKPRSTASSMSLPRTAAATAAATLRGSGCGCSNTPPMRPSVTAVAAGPPAIPAALPPLLLPLVLLLAPHGTRHHFCSRKHHTLQRGATYGM